jgi:3-oxoacyl-[acyl-carrier-protein] synthase-3
VRISGIGVHVPARVLTNAEISEFLDTSDDWILSRTGIRERRIAADAEAPSDLGASAAQRALAAAGLAADDVDLIVSSSVVPDMVFPATAAVIAERIGAGQAGAFDIQAGCTGFVYALAAAAGFVGSGLFRRVLVVGAETLSKGLDWEDRRTCILFGDGAGAAVVEAAPDKPEHVMTFDLGNDGAGAGHLLMPAGGARLPASAETVRDRSHFLKMNGPEVFRFATRVVAQSCLQALERAGLGVEDIDLFVPHQANVRIIDSAAKRLGMPAERVFTNLESYGNTSCASIPLCLAEAAETGRLARGDRLLLCGFGAGLSWGSMVTTWDIDTTGRADPSDRRGMKEVRER